MDELKTKDYRQYEIECFAAKLAEARAEGYTEGYKAALRGTQCVGACQPHRMPKVPELTETEKKIAHYEERARYHWSWWKRDSDKGSLYHYKQCNIKIRRLKQAEGDS